MKYISKLSRNAGHKRKTAQAVGPQKVFDVITLLYESILGSIK
jgi:hypothetical protein